MCCGAKKRRAAKLAQQQAALEATRRAAQMQVQENTTTVQQRPAYAASTVPSTMPPPYDAQAARDIPSADYKEKEAFDTDASTPANDTKYNESGIVPDGVADQPRTTPDAHGAMAAGGTQPARKGCYGRSANHVPWFAYADQMLAKKFAKMHRKRCIDSGCWCRVEPEMPHSEAAQVY